MAVETPTWIARALADSTASVGQLITAALITAVASVAGSLLLARLTFNFVRKKELAQQLQDAMAAKSAELDKQLANSRQILHQTLLNDLAADREKRARDRGLRVRTALAGSAGPLLVAVEELLARLSNIVDNGGYAMLQHDWDRHRPADWSSTHGYFLSSTTYVFGRYFARESILRDRLGADEFEVRDHPLMSSLYGASSALSEFPAPFNETGCTGGDVQVFFWQQRALGEVLTVGTGDAALVMTYAGFLTGLPDMAPHTAPLHSFLIDNADDETSCRWQRLLGFRSGLLDVRERCRELLDTADGDVR